MQFVEGFPQDQLRVFKLDTVTYGTKPTSFLAVRAMHQLSADEHTAFPLGTEVIRRDFYVDGRLRNYSVLTSIAWMDANAWLTCRRSFGPDGRKNT